MKQLTNLLRTRFGPIGQMFGSSAEVEPSEPLQPLIRRRRPRTVIQGHLDNALQIPCPDPTAEDSVRAKHLARAQHLARQERWDELLDLIASADEARHLTPGTMPVPICWPMVRVQTWWALRNTR